MNTKNIYIPSCDLVFLVKHPGAERAAFFLDKEVCACDYAARRGLGDDEAFRFMNKICELELHYKEDGDFVAENADRLSINPTCPPMITIIVAFDLESRAIKGLFTKAAYAALEPDDVLGPSHTASLYAYCIVDYPEV